MKFSIVLLAFVIISCSSGKNDAQKIIDKAIHTAGGDKFLNSTIEFDFRDRHYTTRRDGDNFSHERVFQDSTDTIHDFLNNKGFYREINNQKVDVPDSMAVKYARSVNATIYFALLPYGLNDEAVQKKFMGNTTIDDQPYFIVEVSFKEEGGGEDFNDVFLYWIHEENYTMDYLAYLYYTDGGGLRFRNFYNRRSVNDILFQDYINYKPKNDAATITELEDLYKKGELEEFSRIELKDIKVY